MAQTTRSGGSGAALLTLVVCARAAGGAELGTVEVEAAREAEAAPTDAAFVTVVDATRPSARIASVADLIEHEPGVQVRSRGGLGAFTSVSLRGSDANEVAVFVDGVPLSRAASGVIDLSLLPVDGLERVEVYRGVAPIELGAEAVGGAINLVTRKGGRGTRWRAAAGVGSFGARQAQIGYAAGGRLRVDASLAYRGATGDFTYYDNGGTLLDTSDDRTTVRQNNGFDQVAADTTVAGGATAPGRWRWRLGTHGFWKRQGVPGLGGTGAQTLHARLDSDRLLVDGEVARSGRRADVKLAAFLAYERSAFANPYGEQVGPFGANVSEGESLSAGLRARVDVPWGAHQLITIVGDGRVENRRPYDLLAPRRAGLPATRGLGGVALADEVRLFGDRLALGPGIRLDGAAATLARAADGTPVPEQEASSWFISPRLTVRAQATRWLTMRASAGRFVRYPTLLEQFGDGAFLIGRPAVRPETAWGGDAGLATTVERPRWGLAAEATFFGRLVDDAITFVPAAYAVTVVNIGQTRALGVEARASAHVGRWLRVALDYTFLDAVNRSDEPGAFGKQLPGRPRHQAGARVELRSAPFRLFYELAYVDQVFRDAQNYNPIPGRTLHALGAAFEHASWSLAVEVRNLGDLRVIDLPLGGTVHDGKTTPYPLVDYFDYPLPGRALYATVTYAK